MEALIERADLTNTGPQPLTSLEKRIASIAQALPSGSAFEYQLPGGVLRLVGKGEPAFRLTVHNGRGLSALRSLDEARIGEAYLDGDLDLDGYLPAALNLRTQLTDRHLLSYLWATYGQRFVFGQVSRDKKWISEHYDSESEFYLMFLEKQTRCYSHAYFEREDESLEAATERKLNTARQACGMQPGWRVLDIGAGWGAFTEHGGKRGIRVTSLTISAESEQYVNELIAREKLPCKVIREHFLEYRSEEPFDAIVNLGVTEHLPDYGATLAQYQRLLKPGGRVFLDACAARTKFPFSSYARKHIWPGNATPMHLSDYLREIEKTAFELLYVRNDRNNYLLTTRHWAERLDSCRDQIVKRWGERLYRRFRLYLWGCVHAFSTDDVTAYRLLLELPAFAAGGLERGRFRGEGLTGRIRHAISR